MPRVTKGTGSKAIANYVRTHYPMIVEEARRYEAARSAQVVNRMRAAMYGTQVKRTQEQITALQARLVKLQSESLTAMSSPLNGTYQASR